MTIKILFFAQTRELLNCGQLEWPLTDAVSLSELKKLLMAQGEQWKSVLKTDLLCAINQTLVNQTSNTTEQQINPGDEVAFFPPVTGG